jgi:hypothetical protein
VSPLDRQPQQPNLTRVVFSFFQQMYFNDRMNQGTASLSLIILNSYAKKVAGALLLKKNWPAKKDEGPGENL